MTCLICRRSDILSGFTEVKFQRGEIHLVIMNVPARVCPSCNEAFVEEEVVVRLLQTAQEIYEDGDLETYAEYKAG